MKTRHISAAVSAVRLSLLMAAALAFGVPAGAQAQNRNQTRDVRNYDGYCYAKQKDARTEGTVVGAIVGGLVGSQVSKNERGLGAVLGAVIGGAVGNNAGKSSVKCYNGDYYAYQGRYYDPSPAPSGYATVFYRERPSQGHYSRVYYDRYHHTTPPPYGYSDAWHGNDDNNNPYGWRDNGGNWHEGSKSNHGQHNPRSNHGHGRD